MPPVSPANPRDIGNGNRCWCGGAAWDDHDTWPRCEVCHKPFRPYRAGMRVCSAACRKRRSRREGCSMCGLREPAAGGDDLACLDPQPGLSETAVLRDLESVRRVAAIK